MKSNKCYDPFVRDSKGSVSLKPAVNTVCIGSGDPCNGSLTQLNKPFLLGNSHVVDFTSAYTRVSRIVNQQNFDASSAFYSDADIDPVLYLGVDGGVVIGSEPVFLDPASVVITGSVYIAVIKNMWQTSSRFSMVDPSTSERYDIYSVCHTNDPQMCGLLFLYADTQMIFLSQNPNIPHIVNEWEWEGIAANTHAGILVNKSIVVTSYTSYGYAVPCIDNPLNPPMPLVATLLVSFIDGNTCSVYRSKRQAAVALGVCMQVSAMPYDFVVVGGVDRSSYFIANADADGVTLSEFSDVYCSVSIANSTIQTLFLSYGCTIPVAQPAMRVYWEIATGN